jgi:hypothetical protein
MFDAYCPTHQRTVLLGYGNIERVENTVAGIDLHATCWCGAHLTVHTGRRRNRRAPVVL